VNRNPALGPAGHRQRLPTNDDLSYYAFLRTTLARDRAALVALNYQPPPSGIRHSVIAFTFMKSFSNANDHPWIPLLAITAILIAIVLYARNVTSTGFHQTLRSTTSGGDVAGPVLTEYLSHPANQLFRESPSQASSWK